MLAIDPIHPILNEETTQGRLHNLRGRAPMNHTYLHMDYADVIVAPIKEDIKF
jgi:hypothetical protein